MSPGNGARSGDDRTPGNAAPAGRVLWTRWLGRALALAVAYFVTARLCLSLAPLHGVASAVWPPTGLAIAALHLGGAALWPAVFCGAMAANLAAGVPWWTAAAIGGGNALEALVGAHLLARYGVRHLHALREVFALAAGAAAVSPVVSATVGVAAGVLGGIVPAADWGRTWLAWFVGDALGALIVTPLLLAWSARPLRDLMPRPGEAVLCAALVAAGGALIFGADTSMRPLAYLVFPLLIWSALRLGQAVTTANIALVTALAVTGAWHGTGPFSAPSLLSGLMYVELFVAVLAVTALSLAAAIAERVRSEAQLQEARAQLHLVTTTMAAAVTRCSRDLRYVWVSTPYAAWLGRPVEEIAGRPIAEVLGDAALATIHRHIERVLAGERVEFEEAVDLRGLGARWVHAVYVPTAGRGGAVDGWVAMVTDVTERKALEQRLRDEGTRKDEFLAMLAHELRNPLAPIRNALQLFRLLPQPDPRLEQAREIMERQVAHVVRLVDDLLDLSRVTQGKITLADEVVDLSEVLAEALDTARSAIEHQAHTVTTALAPEAIRLRGDRTRLVQVFGNLLLNAAKFTPAGGRIELTSEYRDGWAVVRVRDTGVGLTADALERIFDLFVQEAAPLDRTPGGLGIGLTLVRRLVELHGGRVRAASAGPGHGSELTVTLPATRAPAAQVGPPASEAVRPDARPLRIFLVDDNADTVASFAALLEIAGHQVHTAANGAAALASADHLAPDVAFIDIGLPGIDGYEVVRRLRERPAWRDTVFVALSGYGRDEDKRRGREAGFDHHLTKPVGPDEIDALLRDLQA